MTNALAEMILADNVAMRAQVAEQIRVSCFSDPDPDTLHEGGVVVESRLRLSLVTTRIDVEVAPDTTAIPMRLDGTTDGLPWTATLDRYDGGAASYEITERT